MPKGTTYGGREEGFAEAVADQFEARGLGSGGGGGSGITQSQVQAAIQAANNIDELETEIKKITALINAGKILVDAGVVTIGNSIEIANDTGNPVPISGVTIDTITSLYTRPADTTAYAANDAISNSLSSPNALNFNNCARINGGSGYVTSAWCSTNQTSFSSSLRLHLFRGNSAPTATNDNSAYALLNSNNINRIGYIDFSNFQTGGAGSDTAICIGAMPQGRNIPFTTNPANSNIYGLLEARSAFVPASGQTFTFYLGVEQN